MASGWGGWLREEAGGPCRMRGFMLFGGWVLLGGDE